MARRLLLAFAIALVVGAGAGLVRDTAIGVTAGIAVAVVGVTVAVLRRNQKDLHELERGEVPEPIDRVLGEREP